MTRPAARPHQHECRGWLGGISVLVDESVTAGRSHDLEVPCGCLEIRSRALTRHDSLPTDKSPRHSRPRSRGVSPGHPHNQVSDPHEAQHSGLSGIAGVWRPNCAPGMSRTATTRVVEPHMRRGQYKQIRSPARRQSSVFLRVPPPRRHGSGSSSPVWGRHRRCRRPTSASLAKKSIS